MKTNHFKKAQELSREAVLFSNAAKWAMAMKLLRSAFR